MSFAQQPSSQLSTDPAPAGLTAAKVSAVRRWTARISGALAIAFLAFDTAVKVLQLAPAMEATTELGFQPGAVRVIGLIQLCCLGLYAVPRTAPIGAVLLTGYLGGAIATHLRVQSPFVSHVLFPLYVAVLVWLPLYLRDARVRALIAPHRA